MKGQQNFKVHIEKGLRPQDPNIPSTPSANKTICLQSPISSFTKATHQKAKNPRLFLSPSNMTKVSHQPQRSLHTGQTPRSKASVGPSYKGIEDNKTLSPNGCKTGVPLLYVPTVNHKKKLSPKPVKVLDTNKPSAAKPPKKASDFLLVSNMTVAAKMKPDRNSVETARMRETGSGRHIVTTGDLERLEEDHQESIEGNLTLQNDIGSIKKDEIQDGKEMDLNLSPISKRKEELSSFLSEREKIMCAKHPLKKAKYKVLRKESSKVSQLEDYYCSECAIEFALNGVQIVKLNLFGFNSNVYTESEEKIETLESNAEYDKEMIFVAQEFTKKVDEAIEEVGVLERNYMDQKEYAQKKADMTEKTIQACSENVIMLFREETDKTIKTLNAELEEEKRGLDKVLKNLKWLCKGFIDIKEDVKELVQQYGKGPFKDTLEEYYERLNLLKNEIKQVTKSFKEAEKTPFEEKINEYKRSLKTVLKEVVMELEKEEHTAETSQPISERGYNEQMMKKLGAFEDFLKADESHDALQMKTGKGKIGDNTMISFGNKEIFENVLQTPTEAITLCSTQGETMVLPVLEDIAGGLKLRESRNCITEEGVYEGSKKNGASVEEYIKFMNYFGNQGSQRDQDPSLQKARFHSPEFKGMGGNPKMKSYFDY